MTESKDEKYRFALVTHSDEIADAVALCVASGTESLTTRIVTLDQAVPVARQMLRRGYEVILAHGGTGDRMVEEIGQPVVTIPRTHLDIIEALIAAREASRQVAVTAYGEKIDGMATIARLLDMDIRQVVFRDNRTLEHGVRRAVDDGFRVIVGGGVSQKMAGMLGAMGFIVQPKIRAVHRSLAAARAVAAARRKEQGETARQQLMLRQKGFVAVYTLDNLVGQSRKMMQLKARAEKYAAKRAALWIYGQTGTGKEILAQAVHNAGSRKKMPFVAVNCAALPESLLESELFGYAEGAFTGARKGGRPGLFELAAGGTLFLDEIADVSPAIQVRLLRVLETKQIMRVGGDKMVPLDVRVISASNRDLRTEVGAGRFRMDLYFRLSTLKLFIPPLKDRPEDIAPLVSLSMEKNQVPGDTVTAAMHRKLAEYHWPGNYRELTAFLESYITLLDGDCDPDLFFELLAETRLDSRWMGNAAGGEEEREDPDIPLKTRVDACRQKIVHDTLSACRYNRKAAADRLDISVNTLGRILRQGEKQGAGHSDSRRMDGD